MRECRHYPREIHEIGPSLEDVFVTLSCESTRTRESSKKSGSCLTNETCPFRGLGAILFKEFIIVWRDPMTLFFMFFPPLVEMIAFGYALDTDVKHMAMMILNEDRTVESRQFIDRFVNTETFRVVGEVQSIDELASEIRRGRAYVGLQIPPTFTRDVRAGHPAQVQLLVDGSNSTTALQALNTALAVGLDAIGRDRSCAKPDAATADRYPPANALQPGDEKPELLYPGRDRHRPANRHDLRHRHGRRARTRKRNARDITR